MKSEYLMSLCCFMLTYFCGLLGMGEIPGFAWRDLCRRRARAARFGVEVESVQSTHPLYACAAVGATIDAIAGSSNAPPTPSRCNIARREIVGLGSSTESSIKPSLRNSSSAYSTNSSLTGVFNSADAASHISATVRSPSASLQITDRTLIQAISPVAALVIHQGLRPDLLDGNLLPYAARCLPALHHCAPLSLHCSTSV